MKVYHIAVQKADGWYAARALEDPAVLTQGRTLDEVVANVRDVVGLLYDEREVQLELILPPVAPDPRRKRKAAPRR
jgi:predicted RNase H-like HicB family nuclease